MPISTIHSNGKPYVDRYRLFQVIKLPAHPCNRGWLNIKLLKCTINWVRNGNVDDKISVLVNGFELCIGAEQANTAADARECYAVASGQIEVGRLLPSVGVEVCCTDG